MQCAGKSSEDWVRCYKSQCQAQPKKLAEHFQIHCTYVPILRRNDFQIEEPGNGQAITFKAASDYFELVDSDFVRIKCKSSRTSERWTGVLIGVRAHLNRRVFDRQRHQKIKPKTRFNVLIFGFDSLSRNAFIRKLPKSYDYLVNQIGSHVLTGYNIVGDGTPQALIPILTGHTELELPETRKRKTGSVSCDAYPMLWKYYQRAGYVTSFNEDLPSVGTFTYRLNGFDAQPTDHYMRPYFLATESLVERYAPLCTGDRPRHSVFMNYTYQLLETESKEAAPKFIFSFHGELSHDSINLIEVADDDLLHLLRELHRNLLKDTIVVVMSDHGNRFAAVRDTFQGKLEERLPYFSFAFPDEFKREYPTAYDNFVENANGRLVTPFDIYRTLRHLIELQQGSAELPVPPNPNHPKRALSLFTPISVNRSCADAYIEPHWCSCLQWTRLQQFDNRAIRAAITVTDQINRLTVNYRDICSLLQVERIDWAGRIQPSIDLVQFQSASDRDGYLGSFDDSKRSMPLYQVKLVTKPGNAVYEATVEHNPRTDDYRVDTAHISRVNKYGEQARCIYARDPELRKFCYCK